MSVETGHRVLGICSRLREAGRVSPQWALELWRREAGGHCTHLVFPVPL